MEELNAIVLAAGQGTRLNKGNPSPIPKVLHQINNKPIVAYVLETLKEVGIKQPVVVVGYQAEKVKEVLGPDYEYALQEEQKGTGHAAAMAKELLAGKDGYTFIINGDSPLFLPATLRKMVEALDNQKEAVLVITTSIFPHFIPYGYVLNDNAGFVKDVIQEKDAPENIKKSIKEKNSGCYLARNDWLWQALDRIPKSEASGEYYITELVQIANKDGKKVIGVESSDWKEGLGINTPEELKEAEEILASKVS